MVYGYAKFMLMQFITLNLSDITMRVHSVAVFIIYILKQFLFKLLGYDHNPYHYTKFPPPRYSDGGLM
jgi:hypothetical protein